MPDAAGRHDDINDVPGIQVGHWTDAEAATGCTVILARGGATAAVDVRGGSPGTRETDLLDPMNPVERLHAVVLAGGSAFGLAAAQGVMDMLRAEGIGHPTLVAKVPIVASAILYDLAVGRADVFPGSEEGRRAAEGASGGPVAQGSIGAGTGASVGKLLGLTRASKGGLGSASEHTKEGFVVGALAVVNAIGEVFDARTDEVVAGVRAEEPGQFEDSLELLRDGRVAEPRLLVENTTLVVVATDLPLTKTQCRRLAIMAHAGVATVVRPVHLPGDGDVLFALSTAARPATASPRLLMTVGALGARAVARAIMKGVRAAEGRPPLPSAEEWRRLGADSR